MNDELERLIEGLRKIVSTYGLRNPMRTADFHGEDCACYRCAVDACNAAVNALPELLAKVKRLEEALNFYAAREHYNDEPLPNNMWKTAKAVFDGGKRARTALKEKPQ